ncbi:virulence factor Mce family protein [Gordonia malaquae]|uniref:Mce family protein n=1 Tax=Gordonia malaquae NBRC 108250 TaxID=1223542 RepID=M3V0P0_GORML|nr:MlaD family protein [Gordonia malaquae]GAC82067.1 Mce family protein [Gordonia malaquae NBRC 108250]SED68451.1 virulence factor Mce family protein [Gordonia malaquae]SEE41590.1 virulence factor Mce family protein [Gordonia malaquae]
MISVNRARLGPLVIALMAAMVFVTSCGINADNPPTIGTSDGNGYDIQMEFTSALNLPALAKVLSEGLSVGTVENVTYENGHAVVKARIDNKTQLPAESRAELRQDTLLGEIYVSILPPAEPSTGALLRSGSVIPLARTEPAANVEDVMRGMANVLGGGELDKIHTAISTLNTAFPKDPQEFDALYRTTLETVSEVSSNTDKLDVVLRSADRTLKVILADPSGIDRMLTKGGTNFYGLGYSLIDVALLIANLRTFATAAGRIVDPEYSRIKESVAAIAPVIASIANSDIYSKSVTEQATRVIRDKLIPFVGSPDINLSDISIDGRDLARRDAESFITVLKSIGMMP